MDKRTHYCGEISTECLMSSVCVMGWIHAYRDHGGILFLDIRDRTGLIQVTISPDNAIAFSIGNMVRSEFVVAVLGVVKHRPKKTENLNISTGKYEIECASIKVLNTSDPLPFTPSTTGNISDEIRLQNRFIDLRTKEMQYNLKIRHQVMHSIRNTLHQNGFLEIETPMLTKPTPEGARDFLVPSRMNHGTFYALPQSPQLFKQILMSSGFDKYYQIARCFRDEDLRSDRQPEFTQVDIEASFTSQSDLIAITEEFISNSFATIGKKCVTPFQQMTYQTSMDRYGTDCPDLRYGLELVDLTDELKDASFKVFASVIKNKGIIRAICVSKGARFSRADIAYLTNFVQKQGAAGLAWMKITDQGAASNIVKFFSQEEIDAIKQKMNAQSGDIVFFSADQWEQSVSMLGALRVEIFQKYDWIKKHSDYEFVWVTDFPLFKYDVKDKIWESFHHPFTAPSVSDDADIYSEEVLKKSLSNAYDIVLNGTEIGGGSIRIHCAKLQQIIFKIIGIQEKEIQEKFGFLLQALKKGTPPHGGIAIGLDRMISLFLGLTSIRDVIAFPKTQTGRCLLSESPSEVSLEQLEDLSISYQKKNKL